MTEPQESRMLVFAHRGASGHEPENTLRAIRRALALGAEWVEVDVHAVEGRLVVIHDDRLERTTNGTGRVMERPLSYLRSLDAGRGERIPLFGEVFDLLGEKAGINVELKGPGTVPIMVDFLRERVEREGLRLERVIVSSLNPEYLRQCRKLDPRIRIGALFDGRLDEALSRACEIGAGSIHVPLPRVTRFFVGEAHRRGLRVHVFTVNNLEDVARMKAIGVDGIFTDYPGRILRAGL